MIYNLKNTGVSVVLGYVILLIITSIGISLLLVGFQGIITNTSDTVEEDEVKMSSVKMASYISKVDSNISGTSTNSYVVKLPSDSIVTKSNLKYTVTDAAEPNIYVLQTSKVSSNKVYRQRFRLTNTSFDTDSVGNSSNVGIEYKSSTNELYFT